MSDERAQVRLANSCNILSEVSPNLPNQLPWLDTTDVEKCHNLIGNNTEDLCEFEKKTFGLGRRNNARKFKKDKREFQKLYETQRNLLKEFENNLYVLKDANPQPTPSEIDLLVNQLDSVYKGAQGIILDINTETKELKVKIAEKYSMVEGSQYKDLLFYYKKIKDNMDEIKKVGDNIEYSNNKLRNKTEKLQTTKNSNTSLRNVTIVFFITGLILALLFRFL